MLRVRIPGAFALALASLTWAGCGATLDSDEEDHAPLLGDSAAPEAWAEPSFEATSTCKTQVGDWLAGKNGLASHTPYRFYQPTAAMRTTVRTLFDKHN